MKVYLGTLNKAKVAAVKEVLSDYEVVSMKVDSGVNKQPLNDEETINGALNRAKNLPLDGLRIGLEAGVQELNGILFLTNFGVLIDEENNVYYAGGTRIPLPKYMKNEILINKKELSEVMEEYTKVIDGRNHEGAISFLTDSLVKRKDIFTHITLLLYGQYLKGRKK